MGNYFKELTAEKVFIIAELGINHNGDFKIAKEMIDKAHQAGVDAVKFQTFRAEEFMSDLSTEYTYMEKGKKKTEKMFDMFKRLELPLDAYQSLFNYANSLGLIPFTSIADELSYHYLLKNIDLAIIKLSSEDLINIKLLEFIGKLNKPVILSSGMANEEEIKNAISFFKEENISLLHCVSLYPTEFSLVNLKRIVSLKEKFKIPIGFSDHSRSLISGALAAGMGASIIEKHFTLDNELNGPDHSFSLNPKDMKIYVDHIRNAELMLGDGDISPKNEEEEISRKFRRGLTLECDLKKGDVLGEEMLSFKRPCPNLKPYQKDLVLGKRAKKNLRKGHKISEEDFI